MGDKVMRFEWELFSILEKSLHILAVMQFDDGSGALYNEITFGQNFAVIVTVVFPDFRKNIWPVKIHITFYFGQEISNWIFFQSLFFHADFELSDFLENWVVDKYCERWHLCCILMHSNSEDTSSET